MSFILLKNNTWFKSILYTAGAYHIIWGFSVIAFPNFWFDLAALLHPNYVQLWQFIGLYEVIFGFGYLLAASNALRHWRVVLMGLVAKISVVIGFTYFYLLGQEPLVVFNMVLSNHIFWLLPFIFILYNVYHHQYLLDNEMIHLNGLESSELLDFYETNKSEGLRDLSNAQPVMMIFLRHFGCTFCKETLWYVQKFRSDIEAKGTRIVLVHMHSEAKANEELKKYNLQDLDTVSDPESMLYKAFHLKRGTLSQVLGLKVWLRGLNLWFSKGAFVTSPNGVDTFQMPGIFLVLKGEIIKKYIHLSAADVPPYLELASCENCISTYPS